MEKIKVAVAEDHSVFRDGICTTLKRTPDMEVCCQAGDGSELLEKLKEHPADVVLMDVQMPVMGGLAAMKAIHANYPGTRVIALTAYSEDLMMLQEGACGYLDKILRPEKLREAIRAVHAGEIYYCSHTSRRLMELLERIQNEPRRNDPELTPREEEVVKLLCKEKLSKEIGAELNLTEDSVNTYRTRIMHKLGARSISGVVKFALRTGLIGLDDCE